MERLLPSPKFQPIKFGHSRETKFITPERWIRLQSEPLQSAALASGLRRHRNSQHIANKDRADSILCIKGKPFFCTTSSRKRRKLQTKTELCLCDAKMPTSKTLKTKNSHRGSSFEHFLKQEGLLENVQAAAFKRALALKVNDNDERKAHEQERNGCTNANVARRGPSAARPKEHIGDTCYTKPRREITRTQSKDRARGSITASAS